MFDIDFSQVDIVLDEAEAQQGDTKRYFELLAKIDYPSFSTTLADYVAGIDPFSAEYLSRICDIHAATIAKNDRVSYSFADEGSCAFDKKSIVSLGGTWGTRDWSAIHNMLQVDMEIASLLKDCSYGNSILECGCGLGGMTEFLALAGFSMDALDVSKAQCKAVSERMRPMVEDGGLSVRVICNDLASFLHETDKRYDVVLFEASFHHFMDHYELLSQIMNEHLSEHGLVLLVNEPIIEEVAAFLPYAWGPRFNGESLFQMRKRGWLELGFTAGYVREMCSRLGAHLAVFPINGSTVDTYAISRHQDLIDAINKRYDKSLKDYIAYCYRCILGREPGEGEVDIHYNWAVANKAGRSAVRQNFIDSEEFKAQHR